MPKTKKTRARARPRTYVDIHKVIALCATAPTTTKTMAKELGCTPQSAQRFMNKVIKAGRKVYGVVFKKEPVRQGKRGPQAYAFTLASAAR